MCKSIPSTPRHAQSDVHPHTQKNCGLRVLKLENNFLLLSLLEMEILTSIVFFSSLLINTSVMLVGIPDVPMGREPTEALEISLRICWWWQNSHCTEEGVEAQRVRGPRSHPRWTWTMNLIILALKFTFSAPAPGLGGRLGTTMVTMFPFQRREAAGNRMEGMVLSAPWLVALAFLSGM